MKKNADERNYTTVDEIENDIISTLASWTNEKRWGWLASDNGVKDLIWKWYNQYELIEKEYDEINGNVLDFFIYE
jgi:hypothetical protein